MHLKKVHNVTKAHPCPLCYYSTDKREVLESHHKNVHLAPAKKFECRDCGRSFAQSAHLTTHYNNVHLKLKPYKCRHCDYTAALKAYLESHIRYLVVLTFSLMNIPI